LPLTHLHYVTKEAVAGNIVQGCSLIQPKHATSSNIQLVKQHLKLKATELA
jgi:hypothetical protein